jgi:hypothetical protein
MMQLQGITATYAITLNSADREHLLIALELAVAVARREPEARVLLADLHADPAQAELAPLLDAMVDTWTAAGADPAAVTLDSALPFAPLDAVKQIDRRVDHVLARAGRPGLPLSVSGAFLAGDRPIEGVYPSDHYAVGVDLEPFEK